MALRLTRAEETVIAHAVNSSRVSIFSPAQREHLPGLGRKLAEYIADNPPKAPKLSKQVSKAFPFANNVERTQREGCFSVLRDDCIFNENSPTNGWAILIKTKL